MIEKTIMSQYANSPRLLAIINGLWDGLDPSKFTAEFYRLVMSIPTANSYGLDVWGRIVGANRTVTFPNPDEQYFGFTDGFYPFNVRPFSSTGESSGAWELSNDAYRELILMKALSNIAYATAPNINALMKAMFKAPCYCIIPGHMKMQYVFEFELTPYQRHLVYNSGILPRPCGVEIDVVVVAHAFFGFNGTGLQPLSQGVFYAT